MSERYSMTADGITEAVMILVQEMGDECPVPECLRELAGQLLQDHGHAENVPLSKIADVSERLAKSMRSLDADIWMAQTAFRWLQKEGANEKKGIKADAERENQRILVGSFYLIYSKMLKKRTA